jgi:hypothetical protein
VENANAWESSWIEPGLRICDINVNIPITLMHATVSELSTIIGRDGHGLVLEES